MEQRSQDLLAPELYFLIQKFLAVSPLTETYKVLSKELEKQKILPARYDWEGNKHERTFEDLERLYPHIGPDHLLDICRRIGPILDKEIPPCIKGVQSLLGSGRQSLLRTADCGRLSYLTNYYATRQNGMPICDPFNPRINHNILHILAGREISGPVQRVLAFPPTRYSQMQLQVQTLGHLSAVYCLLFDRNGKYIISGADDLLVKLWSAYTGRLINSFRGASAEITDIDVNLENTLLAAGSIDKILRVWDLQTGAPVAVLTGHTGIITSVHFCPTGNFDIRYLTTTSSDGSVAFWTYNHDARHRAHFGSKPILYQEKMRPGQSQMICSSFSPGGTFLAAGSADHHVRIYLMRGDEGPIRILETEVHSDRVDSIVWAHRGLQFVSGSKDGTAYIWHFERQQWKFKKLCMDTKLPTGPAQSEDVEQEPKKLFVTMVAWDCTDNFVVTAVSDHCLKVWQASTGQLQRVLTGHTDGVYVLESHPKDPYVMMSTGHDGQLFVWDLLRGTQVAHFINNLDNGQGRGAVFDAKWSPDGSMFAATDSHGHIMIYAFGTDNPQLKLLPKELFFHTDYRPLVRDADHTVLDEQTQVPPHLMPPPFLVDIDGNPYPPMLQRLVPGREHCTSEQLVPNIVIGTGGRQEVIQGLAESAPRSDIDRMIAALAQRQYGHDEAEASGSNSNAASPRAVGNGPRRSGEGSVEGIRQSTGDWQRDSNFVWSKKALVQPLGKFELEKSRNFVETMSQFELADYQREIKKRPLMISTATTMSLMPKGRNRRRRNGNVNTRRTRRSNPPPPRVVDDEPDNDGEDVDVDVEDSNNSTTSNSDSSVSAKEEDLSLSDSSSDTEESSGYSDWVADQGENLEPPKRSKRKPAHRSMNGDDGPGSSSSKPKAKRVPYSKIKNGEIPEVYKDLEWLSKTVPRKAPYCPQMGDEVVYFVQGHFLYVDAVRNKKIYPINNRDLPWNKITLRDKEFVKIVGIKYIIKPPRLCCLKLAMLDDEQKLTDNVFTIKYHDMADVLDFLILKQTYETALSHSWNIGDRFRCMIDDGWWTGKIETKTDLSDEFPGSLFMCYDTQWDNGEKERMCPWDLEPIREDRLPETVGEAVPVLPDEIQSILYQPTVDEWPRGDRDGVCRRIVACLDKVMTLAIAEPFLAPVDLNLYKSYALVVEYPVDLSTIKARFENHFYRRIAAAQFDVRYLAANAEQFNEPHSVIVKSARIITDLCLKIIKHSTEDIDVQVAYHQLMDMYESSCSDDDDNDARPGPSNVSTTRHLQARSLRSCNGYTDWRLDAKRLLEDFFKLPDSAPFRTPVDTLRHPDYFQVIDTPMDLSTVREELFGGNYDTPLDFAKDMRLIFTNSRNFNTNKRSKIYAMTIRLAAKFEEQIQKITYSWKRAKSKGVAVRKSGRKPPSRAKAQDMSNSDNSEKENRYRRTRNTNRTSVKRHMPSTSKAAAVPSSSDDDEEEEENAMVDVERVPRPDRAPLHDDTEEEEEEFQPSGEDEEETLNQTKSSRTHPSTDDHSDDEVLANHRVRKQKLIVESDDSDYEPLSKYANSSNHKRKKPRISDTTSEDQASSAFHDESSSSDSDSGIKKNLRPRSKRRRLQIADDDDDEEDHNGDDSEDTDSDNLPLKRYENRNSDDSGESDHVTSVSSRGRVRKLTEKARTLWKK